MTIALAETNKALQQALYLNLVTTGGFDVALIDVSIKAINNEQFDALVINQQLVAPFKASFPDDTLTIVYQPVVSNINEPCSVKVKGPLFYSLRFSMAALPGFSEAINQILVQN